MRCWLIAPDRHQSQKKTPPGGGHTSGGADRYDSSLHWVVEKGVETKVVSQPGFH